MCYVIYPCSKTEMATSKHAEEKEEVEGVEQSLQCNFCRDKGNTNKAHGFCLHCGKYLCALCENYHGQFLSGHELVYGSEMPKEKNAKTIIRCKLHTEQAVELFCKQHNCVFCKFCKSTKHSKCEVKTIQDALKGRNITEELDAKFEDLFQLQKQLETIRRESENKLSTYSKDKKAMLTKIRNLRKEIDNMFNIYENQIDLQEQTDLEILNSNLQTCTSFERKVGAYLKSVKQTRPEMNDQSLFSSLVESIRVYNKYKIFLEQLHNKTEECGSFLVQDENFPSLIQQLSDTCCRKTSSYIEPKSQLTANDTIQCDGFQIQTMDQSCQMDKPLRYPFEDVEREPINLAGVPQMQTMKQVKSPISAMSDIEEDGSQEVTETMTEKLFCNIKACSVTKEIKTVQSVDIKDCCLLPDGQIILCDSECLKILENDTSTEVQLPLYGDSSPEHIELLDNNSVVISIHGLKCLQIINIKPTVKPGREIVLKYKCDGLVCYDRTIFVYSRALNERNMFSCHRIQILSPKGDTLKNIYLLDDLRCFCIRKDGNITYFSDKGLTDTFFKCVTKEQSMVFSYPSSEIPNKMVCDEEGNAITLHSSNLGKICVVKSDGTGSSVLIKGSSAERLVAFSYNKTNNILLVAFVIFVQGVYGGTFNKTERRMLKLYELEYM